MTVPVNKVNDTYTGTGAGTVHPYTFRILKESDLLVRRLDLLGVLNVLVITTDYTVQGVGLNGGGSITLTVPIPIDETLLIDLNPEFLQLTDLRDHGSFKPETHELVFDRITQFCQVIAAGLSVSNPNLSRVLTMIVGDIIGSGRYDALSNRIVNMDDPVDAQDAATMAYVLSIVSSPPAGGEIPVFTLAGRPAATALWYKKFIIVKDPGSPGVLQILLLKGDDTTYEWVDAAQGAMF